MQKAKIEKFEVGDAVTVKVPNKGRGPFDQQRVPGVIVQICIMTLTKSEQNMAF